MNDSESLIPEPWLSAVEAAGVVDQRTGLPSVNALALKAGLARVTVWKVVRGEYATAAPPETLAKLATALRLKPATVAKWSNQSWEEFRPFEVPAEADLLPQEARDTVTALIRLLAKPYQQGAEATEVVDLEETRAQKKTAGHPRASRQSAEQKKRG